MKEVIQDAIEKIAEAAEADGIDLSADELADLAFRKLAQEAESEESDEEEDEEEGEGEDEEEEAKQAADLVELVVKEASVEFPDASPEELAEIASIKLAEGEEDEEEDNEEEAKQAAELIELAVKEASNEFPDADPEDIAKVAYEKLAKELTPTQKLENIGAYVGGGLGGGAAGGLVGGATAQKLRGKAFKRALKRRIPLGAALGIGAGVGLGHLDAKLRGMRDEAVMKQLRQMEAEKAKAAEDKEAAGKLNLLAKLRKGIAKHPLAAAGGAAAAGAGAGLGGMALYNKLQQKEGSQKTASDFETDVVKRAREHLVTAGFNPDTGQPMSKIALAQDYKEAVELGALELLESRKWPVQWNPEFLANRAAGR